MYNLAQVATDRRAVIDDFVFDDSLPLIVVLVPAHRTTVSVAALPSVSALTLPLDLPSPFSAGSPDLVRDSDKLRYVLLEKEKNISIKDAHGKVGGTGTNISEVLHDVEEILSLLVFVA
jgi:hypothetical protein